MCEFAEDWSGGIHVIATAAHPGMAATNLMSRNENPLMTAFAKVVVSLGVEAMSLYNHVANKEDLLHGMVDAVFGEIELPSHIEDWQTAMRKRSLSFHNALERHPWATGLRDSGTRPGPVTLRHHDRVLGTLRNAGFSLPLTAHAISLIDSYIYGFAMQEKSLPFHTEEETAAMAQIMLSQLSPVDYPYLAELTMDHVLQHGYNYSDEFAEGLDLILDALDSVRNLGSQAPPTLDRAPS